MSRRRRSGCCLGQLIKMVLVLLLFGGTGYWIYSRFLDNNDEFVDYYKEPIDEKEMHIHESHYDYSEVAKSITDGCDNNYRKIRAIYQWICDNIEYDTSYSIYTADSCYDEKKGVCQAYCELFYHIAKAAGVSAEVIIGKSKDWQGLIGDKGHAWLFAYTSDKRGILMDPTWGAGSVNDGKFVRSENCWDWFDVPPEWMILSHFPQNESYQLVGNPLSMEEFISLKPVNNLWIHYGLDVHDLFMKVRNHQLEMPIFYSGADGVIKILDMPMCTSLRIGKVYAFRVKIESDKELTIINNKNFTESDKWNNEGNGVYSINYMVKDVNSLKLSIKSESENVWHTFIEYYIDSPTSADWEKVEEEHPLSIPEVKNVKNLDAEAWEKAGVDGHQMLRLIRENGIRELPILYSGKGQKLKILSIPMTKRLMTGETYTFRFIPESGKKWAIINGGKWYNDWHITDDGAYSITIMPSSMGELNLSVQLEENGSYWSCLEYEIN